MDAVSFRKAESLAIGSSAFLLLAICSFPSTSLAETAAATTRPLPQPRTQSLQKLAQGQTINVIPPPAALRGMRVGVLDTGFGGYVKGTDRLPRCVYDHSRDLAKENPAQGPNDKNPHGFWMAQMLWKMSGGSAEGPCFYLLNSKNYSNLKYSIEEIILKKKLDLVVMANNFETGGNGDGAGYYNALVQKATDAGVVWVNAAGNYGQSVYAASVLPVADTGYVPLPDGYEHDRLQFKVRIPESQKKNNQSVVMVKITLSWSDFRNSETECSPKDLDLFLTDASGIRLGGLVAPDGTRVFQGRKIQDGKNTAQEMESDSARSCYPYERINIALEEGDYSILVAKRSANFTTSDTFRVLVTGASAEAGTSNFIEMPSHSDGNEIFVPADHPDVITVGATGEFSSRGPTLDGRHKPDVLLDDTTVDFKGIKDPVDGSSNAAGLLAGLLTRQIALERERAQNLKLKIETDDLKDYFKKLKTSDAETPSWVTPAPGVSILDP